MESKLDKEEYYQKANQNSMDEDNLKMLGHNLSKAQKKLDSMNEEVSSKLKKLKKKLGKAENKIDGALFEIEDLKGRKLDFDSANVGGPVT
jgi:tetrahydromethanopterin S-methyltransferase subunit G